MVMVNFLEVGFTIGTVVDSVAVVIVSSIIATEMIWTMLS
jgi:hypothetical protein